VADKLVWDSVAAKDAKEVLMLTYTHTYIHLHVVCFLYTKVHNTNTHTHTHTHANTHSNTQVKRFLRAGVSVHMRDDTRATLLHVAVRMADTSTVGLLIGVFMYTQMYTYIHKYIYIFCIYIYV